MTVQRQNYVVRGNGGVKTLNKVEAARALFKGLKPSSWLSQAVCLALLLFFTSPSQVMAKTLAFPGASGGGALSVGGRGGQVLEVTNLNNAGPGSFRAACEAQGPRIVVFRVGGTIVVKDEPIVIRSPYITIAGQTAPGDGILLRSDPSMTQPPLLLKDTHDVIIRYLRVRPGPMANRTAGDAISTYIHVHNLIIDHCSLSWATDENTEAWTKNDPGYNITWSWNIIAEGLGSHSCGLLSGSGDNAEGMHDISVHHNLFAHNGKRSPNLKVKTAEIINNIIYGWKYYATQIGGGTQVDIIGNKFVAQTGFSSNRGEVLWKPYNPDPIVYGRHVDPASTGPKGDPSIYFEGNIGPHNSDPAYEGAWNKMTEMTDLDSWGYPDGGRTPIPLEFRRSERRHTTNPVKVDRVEDLDNILTGTFGVGASMRLDENGKRVSNRGVIDTRILNEYKNGKGTIPETLGDMDYPILEGGTPYQDSDHDGMPDKWEIMYGFNPFDPSDSSMDADHDDYTNIEEFLNVTDPVGTGDSQDGPVVRSFVAEPNPAKNPYTRVNFFVHATTGDGAPIKWQIDFGDGTHASSLDSASHVYSKAGTYIAKVTVSDHHGHTASKLLQIVINDSPPAPVTGLQIGAVSLE